MKGDVFVYGEVLFDHFPDGRRVLGGAPFNVAWHLQAFGACPRFVSRIGSDEEGEIIRQAMSDWRMAADDLEVDSALPSGRVNISLRNGEPTYDIEEPAAWDAIATSSDPADAAVYYHGTLALRGKAASREASFVRALSPDIIFMDVNLRAPWWQPDAVRRLLHRAHWVKLNGDELTEIHGKADALDFMQEYDLRGLVLTHGAAGAEIHSAAGERILAKPGKVSRVVDTVGAGDAFASVMILGLLRGWTLQESATRAQEFAAAIVGQRGATTRDRSFYNEFCSRWEQTQDR
jgi:fructokinase